MRCQPVHVSDPPCLRVPNTLVAWAWDGALLYPSFHYSCMEHAYEVYQHMARGHWSDGRLPRWLVKEWVGPLERSALLEVVTPPTRRSE